MLARYKHHIEHALTLARVNVINARIVYTFPDPQSTERQALDPLIATAQNSFS